MLKNFFKIAYRNFMRQRVYSLVNTTGLAIGVVCFLLIFLYIHDELSYDTFHSKSDRTYRVIEHFESDGVGEHSASQPFPVGPTLQSEYPGQVEYMTRLFNFQSPFLALANRTLDRNFNEPNVFFVDSTFFDVFDYELVVGDKNTALDEPNAILITESMAKKYFSDQNPLGQNLQFQGEQNLVVKGVLADAPLNAHFQYDFLISFATLRTQYPNRVIKGWYWNPCWTYLVLKDQSEAVTLTSMFPDFVQKYFDEGVRDDVALELQPLTDIHLKSKLDYEIKANSNENNIYVFSAVAVFVLLIAVINFINLSTARATKRAKEVGIRKALGSLRQQLICQFVFESLLQTVFAIAIAMIGIVFLLPSFNALTEKSITLLTFWSPLYISAMLGLILFIGLIAGFYPAFVLSSFKTTEVIKGGKLNNHGIKFRRVLVVLQFSISMILIAGTIMAILQLNYLQDSDLGFDQKAVVMIPVIKTPIAQHYENMKSEMLSHATIRSVTALEEVLGAKHQVMNYEFEGTEKSRPYPRLFVRHDFLKTFDIPLLAGRAYDPSYVTDDSLALVVNETMIKQLGYGAAEQGVGKSVKLQGRSGKIVGVVEDFNFTSKHHPMSPIAVDLWTAPFTFNLFMKYMAVKVDRDNLPASLVVIEKTWQKFIPSRPFEYFFLEDRLAASYKSEAKLSMITTVFSGLAILVACLGLFGLATFTMEQRTKEIGIRKVLGIKTREIVLLLSKDFMVLVGLSFIIAVPVAYVMIDWWLAGFAYRIDVVMWPFLVAGGATFSVAMLTVGIHSLKAATINPARTLKYE
ncbi:ABC transporter permease [Reichenbachiella carrageenanivorans]|uniref:ABC transporter permease n=1 Tax=Reichenbachiella carrageenanivorans TaxID=2979869 RepID=A0ABY6CWG2_9BACT|nr:ABC transporter permease [Reichenbachiella carrageenanivorans]UXX78254.1 ABC transporter permease [Reichenbachiella carrageenanivorans]